MQLTRCDACSAESQDIIVDRWHQVFQFTGEYRDPSKPWEHPVPESTNHTEHPCSGPRARGDWRRSTVADRRLPPALENIPPMPNEAMIPAGMVRDWLYGKEVPVYVDDVFAGHETTPGLVERVWTAAEAGTSCECGRVIDALRAELGEEA